MNSPNDPALRSFIDVAAESHFPIQNLPWGVFRHGKGPARVGTAIGSYVLDLALLEELGLLDVASLSVPKVFARPTLNPLMECGRAAWREVRAQISSLLSANEPTLRDDETLRKRALLPAADCEMLMPAAIGDYTDFYSSKYHASNVGTMLRGPENALPPNWLHLPIAYHGRSSSVMLSGTDFRRPQGQTKSDMAATPSYGPSRNVDFELEMACFIGPGNRLGESVPIDQAEDQIFGVVLMNDWSARDLQKWEYAPLGPFLAKNFATSISPWVVPLEALEPFRVEGETQDPPVLDYLQRTGPAAFDIQLEVRLSPEGAAESTLVTQSNARHLYWSMSQQIAHHTVNGCNLRPGDLLGTGTISGPTPESRGCLLERTMGGREPLDLAAGGTRRFLEDGDRVTMTGWCQGDGYRVGFGQVTGQLLPAR